MFIYVYVCKCYFLLQTHTFENKLMYIISVATSDSVLHIMLCVCVYMY